MEIQPEKRRAYWRDAARLFFNILIGGVAVSLSLILMIIPFIVMSSVGSATDTQALQYYTGDTNSGNQLLSIVINNEIVGDDQGSGALGLFSGSSLTSGYAINQQLRAAADQDKVKGVILEINSPGGTIFGSKAIAEGVEYYKQRTQKPVLAFIAGLGASGAYMAALTSDAIYADYGSAIGSVGVIVGPFMYYDKLIAMDGGLLSGGVVTENGIQSTYITAGKYKDSGSPYRKLTEAETAIYQKTVDNEYNLFVSTVVKARGIDETVLRTQIGALAYDNQTALEYKLIDGTKSRTEAYNSLAAKAKLGSDYQVVRQSSAQSLIQSLLTATHLLPQKQQMSASDISALRCSLTRTTLAYSGSISALCP